MTVNQKWLEFMREQYPKGSRVELREMNDPYSPIEAGTKGTLKFIDDVGTFHCAWDNGRTLGLIMGEDRFSIHPPELNTLKLYMPMLVDYYERDEWGNMENEPIELTGSTATAYVDSINAALKEEMHSEEAARGLMTYYSEKDKVNDKVKSFVFKTEVKDGKLWGVAECKVCGELNTDELEVLKEYITGQAADGFGEGFEQREIKTPDGMELYAHLWQWDGWGIQTEQELSRPKIADGLPERCFSTIASTGELIIIKRGESGYYRSDWNTDSRETNREIASEQNERLGVSAAQEQAMSMGSMFGWNIPGADPKAYEQKMETMDIV